MHSAVRLALVFVTVLALALSVASPAGAATSPYTASDAVGDVAAGGGDITSISVVNKATKLTLKFTTRRGVDPSTSPTWDNGFTRAQWLIETDAFPGETFNLTLGNRLAPLLSDTWNIVPCPGATSGYTTSTRTYRVTVPKSCLGGVSTVQVRLLLGFVPTPPTGTLDWAPATTYTPKIRQQ